MLESNRINARVERIDALRGFALLGVVISNMAVMAGAGRYEGPTSNIDNIAGQLDSYLITGKFLALFALLFGIGFGMQLRRASERGSGFVPRYLKRMAVLFVIGFLHQVLGGLDILMDYAVLGAVLLLFRNASNRVLLLAAVASLLVPMLWLQAERLLDYTPQPLVDRATSARLRAEGPYLDLVQMRALLLTRYWRSMILEFSTFALFAAGFYAARRRVLEDVVANRTFLLRLLGISFVLTVLGHLAQPPFLELVKSSKSAWLSSWYGILWTGTTYVQAMFYAAAFILAFGTWRALRVLAPAGRMALTNYLSVSLIGTLIFFFGIGIGVVRPLYAQALGLLLWILQIAWSHLWFERLRQGPVEYVWRRASAAP